MLSPLFDTNWLQAEALTLNEAKSSSRKGVLRTIGGVFSVSEEAKGGNRNGRAYTRSLLENRIVNAPYTREMIANKTLFGEPGHPANRLDISLLDVSHSITELKMVEGVVHGKTDILDTPGGRIMNSLLEYGSVIGISSRGAGKTTKVGSKDRVDEDTYVFYTYDLVTRPSFETARLSDINEGSTPAALDALLENVRQELQHGGVVEVARARNLLSYLTEETGSRDMQSLLEEVDGAIAEAVENPDLREAQYEINLLRQQLASRSATHASDPAKEAALEEDARWRSLANIRGAEIQNLNRDLENLYLVVEDQQRRLTGGKAVGDVAQSPSEPLEEAVAEVDVDALLEARLRPFKSALRLSDEILDTLSEGIVSHVARLRQVDEEIVLTELPESVDVGDYLRLLDSVKVVPTPTPVLESARPTRRYVAQPAAKRSLVEEASPAKASLGSLQEDVGQVPSASPGLSGDRLTDLVRRMGNL